MASPAPSPAPVGDGAVLALLGRLEDDPKLAGKGLGSAFAASFPDLPAEASSLAATEAARVAVILGVPGIAVMDVTQLASSSASAGEKVSKLLGLVAARLEELREGQDVSSFATPGSGSPPPVPHGLDASLDAHLGASPSTRAGMVSAGSEGSPEGSPPAPLEANPSTRAGEPSAGGEGSLLGSAGTSGSTSPALGTVGSSPAVAAAGSDVWASLAGREGGSTAAGSTSSAPSASAGSTFWSGSSPARTIGIGLPSAASAASSSAGAPSNPFVAPAAAPAAAPAPAPAAAPAAAPVAPLVSSHSPSLGVDNVISVVTPPTPGAPLGGSGSVAASAPALAPAPSVPLGGSGSAPAPAPASFSSGPAAVIPPTAGIDPAMLLLIQHMQSQAAQQQSLFMEQFKSLQAQNLQAQQAHSEQVAALVASHKAQMDDLRKEIGEARAEAAANKAKPDEDDEERNLLYAPHYDGSFQSPVVAPDGTVTQEVVINPFTAGRTLSDKATYGDMPRVVDTRETDVTKELAKGKTGTPKSARQQEFQVLYSSCSYLFDALQLFQESIALLIAPDSQVDEQKEVCSRLQNTFHGAFNLLMRRLNTIELLTAADSDSVSAEDKIVIKAQLKQLELQCPGFSQFLGNHSMVDPKLKAMIKTMDSQHITETNRYLVKASAQAAVDLVKGGKGTKATAAAKKAAKKVGFKSRVTTTTNDAKGVDVNIKADGGKT